MLLTWLYLEINPEAPAGGCEAEGSKWWWLSTLRNTAPLYVVSASYPFATYHVEATRIEGVDYFRVNLWVGVMHWPRVFGYDDLPEFLGQDRGGRVVSAMAVLGEMQAWVNWKANPDLHPDLACDSYIEYVQVFPCHGMEVWDLIEDGAGSPDVPLSNDRGYTMGEDGAYATPNGTDGAFVIRRPALSYAGAPKGSNGPLFSCMGRMVKAEGYVRRYIGGEILTREWTDREAAEIVFDCVFGGRASVGVSLTYVPVGEDVSNTVRGVRGLTSVDLRPLDDVRSNIGVLKESLWWQVDSFDLDEIERDLAGR